jgi:hypothetical protein
VSGWLRFNEAKLKKRETIKPDPDENQIGKQTDERCA